MSDILRIISAHFESRQNSFPWQRLLKKGNFPLTTTKLVDAPELEEKESDTDENDDRLLCFACSNPVTSMNLQVSIEGGCKHTFTNPSDITFHIGCFRLAAGCTADGTPTYEFSWFPGYAWMYTHCQKCSTHLGWKFLSSAGGQFYGLILVRLTLEKNLSLH